jgi:hypothetical protein
MDRRERRTRTESQVRRRWKIHLGWWHRTWFPAPNENCYACRTGPGAFKKVRPMGCRCQRKTNHHHGSPKIGGGLCRGGGYHPSAVERIEGKRACQAWLGFLVGGVEPDDTNL